MQSALTCRDVSTLNSSGSHLAPHSRERWTLARKRRLAELYLSPARLSYAEIGRRMGITVAAVKAQVAKQRLDKSGYLRPRGPRIRDEHRPIRPGMRVLRKGEEVDESRPQLPQMGGWVKCLKCGNKFLSEHRVNIRRCSRCKKGERENPFESECEVAYDGD